MRLLLSFILTLSLSLACDQPYEEVEGYKIGCPFDFAVSDGDGKSIDENLTSYSLKDEGIQKKLLPMPINDVGFQKALPARISVYVMGGNIEGATFHRTYDDAHIIQNDIKFILSSIKDMWGGEYEYKKAEDLRFTSYSIRDIKSEILDNVIIWKLWSHHGHGFLSISFVSKKMQNHIDLMRDTRPKHIFEKLYRHL